MFKAIFIYILHNKPVIKCKYTIFQKNQFFSPNASVKMMLLENATFLSHFRIEASEAFGLIQSFHIVTVPQEHTRSARAHTHTPQSGTH